MLDHLSCGAAAAPMTFDLTVDEEDDFFFDHPLDHVPGMLLLENVLRAAEKAAVVTSGLNGTGWVTGADIEFTEFCEKDEPARIQVTEYSGTPARTVRIGVVQGASTVCTGKIILASGTNGRVPGVPPCPPPAEEQRFADKCIVHKHHRSNVLVGPLLERDDGTCAVDVVRPSPPRARELHSVSLLVEPVRQFSTMIGHLVEGIPLDWRFIIERITLALSEPVVWSDRLWLHCRPPRTGRRIRGTTTDVWVGDRRAGRVSIGARAVSPAALGRLRASQRRPSQPTVGVQGRR